MRIVVQVGGEVGSGWFNARPGEIICAITFILKTSKYVDKGCILVLWQGMRGRTEKGRPSSLLWELGQKTGSLGRWQISSAQMERSGKIQNPGSWESLREREKSYHSVQGEPTSFPDSQ